MHHFDPELDPENRKIREKFIENRERHLQIITTSASENAIKYLFATNAGGAIAILTYFGAISSNTNQQQALKYSLVLFFIGVILVGVYHTLITETYGSIFKKFQASSKSYFADKRDWESFMAEIQQQVKPSQIPRVVVYASFVCFISGCLLGAMSLFTWFL